MGEFLFLCYVTDTINHSIGASHMYYRTISAVTPKIKGEIIPSLIICFSRVFQDYSLQSHMTLNSMLH